MNNNKRLTIEWSLLLFAALTFVFIGIERGFAERLDLRLLDFATEQMAGEASEDIALVTIDDRSLAEVGTWPWDRSHFADLITGVSAGDPKAIVFDVLLIEPSNPESDARLAESIVDAGNVILPHTFAPKIGALEDVEPVLPLAAFVDAAAGVGHVAVFPDSDGIVRRFSRHYSAEGVEYPHLAIVASQFAAGGEPGKVTHGPTIPVFPPEPVGSYLTISAVDILTSSIPPEFLQGKTILIGATAQGLGDRYSVPNYSGRIMSGVEIQASMLAAVEKDRLIGSVSPAATTFLLGLAIVLLMIVFWKATPRASLVFAFALIAILLVLAMASVWFGHRWLIVGPALGAIVIAYPLWGWRRLALVSRFLEAEAKTLEQSAPGKRSYEGSGFDAVARQVSQVRQLTAEVKESLEFIRGIVDAAPDPMLVFDKNRQLALMNEKAMSLFSIWSVEERPHFPELVAGARARYDAESKELTLPDGRSFLVAKAPLAQDVASEVMILREITELKTAERQRQEMLEFLSHDMRSPQVAIIGLTGNSGQTLGDAERLVRIEGQARRTLSLAENFVQIARLGYDGIRREEADIGSLLYEAADRAYPRAKRKGVEIETLIPEEPDFCLVDPYAISRVIDNLLDNAIKFTPKGKKVSLELVSEMASQIEFAVTDEGDGFPEDRRRAPFTRFGPNSPDDGPSVGLGLAYVARAVEEHGGDISLESETGKGSRITVRLPRLSL